MSPTVLTSPAESIGTVNPIPRRTGRVVGPHAAVVGVAEVDADTVHLGRHECVGHRRQRPPPDAAQRRGGAGGLGRLRLVLDSRGQRVQRSILGSVNVPMPFRSVAYAQACGRPRPSPRRSRPQPPPLLAAVPLPATPTRPSGKARTVATPARTARAAAVERMERRAMSDRRMEFLCVWFCAFRGKGGSVNRDCGCRRNLADAGGTSSDAAGHGRARASVQPLASRPRASN